MDEQVSQQPTIPVEETPEIPLPKQSSFWSTLGGFLFFVCLFILGVWLSSFLRQFVPQDLVGITPEQQQVAKTPTATPTPSDPYVTWKTYDVISGVTFKLPPDVLAPICDTTSCISKGTYLPGGTRFTVASRDSSEGVITDVNGIVFTTKEATVSGFLAKEFTGTFSGKTTSGYGFSKMRGFMIDVTSTLTIEMNHFIPLGITADFATDDVLFDKIVRTLISASSK